MASTYTVNLGIEKIGTGEQSGTWGATTNTNFDLIDQAVNGAVTVTLASAGTSGVPNTLAITNGAASDGRNKFIEFNDGGDLGATAYVQLTPNDAEKIVHIRNSLSGGRSLILFQGTYNASNDFEVPNGKDVVLKFDGAGASATVTDVFTDLQTTGLTVTGTTSLAGASTTADITFGDNDKAIFGAGSDLQIYHTGSNSIIDDLGTGNLLIRSDGAAISLQVNSKNSVRAVADEDVELYYNGSQKLATTSTGIDVTGTVTADGLTVNTTSATPNTFSDSTGAVIDLTDTGGATDEKTVRLYATGQNLFISNRNDDLSNKGNRLQIANNGDISFYDDSGSAKFFWDASAERLGLGTTSPAVAMHINNSVNSSSGPVEILRATTTTFTTRGLAVSLFNSGGVNDAGVDFNAQHTANATLTFSTDSTERMRIDSSGNVGIGTSSPGSLLELEATGSTVFDGTSTDGQAADGTTLAIQNLSDTDDTFSQILFRNRNASKAVSRIASLTDSTGTEMAFVVENNGSPATLAPMSVRAKSPIVVPEDTTAALKSTSVASMT